jgi:hypothetical protein
MGRRAINSKARFMDSLRATLEAIVTASETAVGFDRHAKVGATPPVLLFPGAFNPVHEGHWALARAAERLLDKAVAFEISIVNMDKPPLSTDELCRRLEPLLNRVPVWVTRLPTFVEKAHGFPGVVFVVGADTAERILAPRYYVDGERGVLEGLSRIRSRGCRFLVGGRVNRAGTFACLEGISIPGDFADLFSAITEDQFRQDISSTEIRAGLK